jgi:hypothetical protein
MMNGANIQEQPCPRCGIRRTVRYRSLSFCFNCHQQWDGVHAVIGETIQEALYQFTAAEMARLMIYRAAIRAGFYNDR